MHGAPTGSDKKRSARSGGHLDVEDQLEKQKNYTSDSMHSIKSAAALLSPPDGGFGWVVVFGSFLIHVVADGVTYSYGALLPILLDVFHGGESATGAVGSTLFGVTLSVGPIAGALVNRYGCRPVTIAGALIATLATILSMFSPNIAFMIVTFGLLTGFGFGLIYLPAIVSVTQWFEKNRSFATGIAVCGSGVGTFLFSPLSKVLVNEYDWQGTFLIIAGIIFNCCVFGAMFRPVEYDTVPTVTTIRKFGADDSPQDAVVEISMRRPKISTSSLKDKYGTGADELRSLNMIGAKSDTHIHVQRPNAGRISPDSEPTTFLRQTSSHDRMSHGRSRSRLRLETVGREVPLDSADVATTVEAVPLKGLWVFLCILGGSQGNSGWDQFLGLMGLLRFGCFLCFRGLCGICIVEFKPCPPLGEVKDVKEVMLSPLAHRDALYTRSLINIPAYRENPPKYRESMLDLSKAVVIDSAGEPSFIEQPVSAVSPTKQTSFDKIMDGFKEMLDPSLTADWVFILFTVSNFLTSLAFQVPYIFLPDRAEKQLEIEPKDAAFLLSIVGIANVVGRLVFGFLSDRPQINRLWLYNAAVTVAGAAMSVSVLCQSYATLAAFATVFGLFIGAFVTLTSVILVDLFGVERLTNAFGLLLFFQGLASFIGPPLAGVLREHYGNYDIAFIVFGVLMAASGAMLFFIPCIRRLETAYRGRRSTSAVRYTASQSNGINRIQNGASGEQISLLRTNESSVKGGPLEVIPVITINDQKLGDVADVTA